MDREDWQRLADAFYALAHGDEAPFDLLPDLLKELPAGRICARYLEERDSALLEEAGYQLTGSRHWYVCLGR
jgi:hypothetical protein